MDGLPKAIAHSDADQFVGSAAVGDVGTGEEACLIGGDTVETAIEVPHAAYSSDGV